MATWLTSLRSNWDALLAFSLAYLAIAMNLGPGYYFLTLYVTGCAYIVRTALKR
jgi:hypothetical protein